MEETEAETAVFGCWCARLVYK